MVIGTSDAKSNTNHVLITNIRFWYMINIKMQEIHSIESLLFVSDFFG